MKTELESKSYAEIKEIAKEYQINPNQKKHVLIEAIVRLLTREDKEEQVVAKVNNIVDEVEEFLGTASEVLLKVSREEFFELIKTAITSKIQKDVDVTHLFKEYEKSNVGNDYTEIINWAIKKILG
jgi:hypothetical protein